MSGFSLFIVHAVRDMPPGTCLPLAPRGHGEGLMSGPKHAELWERWTSHASESPGPGTLVTSSYSSKDLFSSSYLDLFLNLLGMKLTLEGNAVVTRGLLPPLASPREVAS